MADYLAYGLRVRSDIDLPGGLTDLQAADAADIMIERAPPCRAQAGPVFRLEGEALCFTAPRVATYHCRTDHIRVAPHPDADMADVEALLIATALPALLWMRGGFVLHASAARLAGQEAVIAIAGASGSGKSTILAQLVDAGASILADDTVLLTPRSRSMEAAGLAGGYFRAQSGQSERSFHRVPTAQSLVRAPIASILVLSRGERAGLTRAAPVAAVAQLLANRHRPQVPVLLGRQAMMLADSTLLAGAAPIYMWQRPAGALELAAWEWDGLALCSAGKGIEHDGQALAAQ